MQLQAEAKRVHAQLVGTSDDIIERFLSRYREPSRTYYSQVMLDFKAFIEKNKGFRSLKTESSTDFIYQITGLYFDYKKDKIKKPSTYQKYLSVIKAFFNWSYSHGIIERPVDLKMAMYRSKAQSFNADMEELRARKRLVSEGQMKKMIRYCKHYYKPMYAPLLLMWNYGLRASEIRNVTRKDFVKSKGEYYFYRYGKAEKRRSRGSWRKVPKELMRVIIWHFKQNGNINNPDGYLLTKAYKRMFSREILFSTKPLTTNGSLQLRLTKLSKLLLGKKVKTHDIRRSRATELVSKGVNRHEIQHILNMSENTLRIYDKHLYDPNTNDIAFLQSL